MSDLERIVREFATEFESGAEPDPGAFLARVGAEERNELAAQLDAYLIEAPTRAWDPEAYASSPARQAVDRVYESVAGVSGSWPEVLPHLRHTARIKRRTLVEQLAERLGFPDETRRVADYYHRMEHGRLPAGGVSERVLVALGTLLETPAESLRTAGERLVDSGAGGAGEMSFARTATPDPSYGGESLLPEDGDAETPAPPPAGSAADQRGPARRDALDELFLGPED